MLEFFRWVFNVVKIAISLDVADLSYLYVPHNLEYTLLSRVGVPRPGVFFRIGSFIWRMFYVLWKRPLSFKKHPPNSVLFFAKTNNQERALRTLADNIAHPLFVGVDGFGTKQLPVFWAYFFSIPFLPCVCFKFFKAKGAERKAFSYVFDFYWLSYGVYILVRQVLRKTNPDLIVLANDHVMWTRVFILAARDADIPTVYIQHASVTERFPPLTVDYALLEGKDTAEKYATRGKSKTKAFLIGIPRLDQYFSKINYDHSLQTIGVCVGLQNTPEQLEPLCRALQQHTSTFKFVLRPHPADPRKEAWQKIASEANWQFSNNAEDAFQYLSRVDAIVSGDSNILLEAVLMNVNAICYDFSGENLDWYGFQKHGLVEYFSEPNSIVQYLYELLDSLPSDVRNKAKRYCSTINTKYDGCSQELAVELINQFVNRNSGSFEDWQLIDLGNYLSVYEPV